MNAYHYLRLALAATAISTAALPAHVAAAAAANTASANAAKATPDSTTIMTVDGRHYSARVTDIMFSAARNVKKDITYNEYLDSLAENQLMAKHASSEMGRAKLLAADKVGFAPAIMLQDQFSTLIKQHFYKQIDATVRAMPDGNLNKLLTWQIPRTDAAVKELTTLRDIGEVRLTPAQMDLARKTRVATLNLPDGKTRHISWHDLYIRENVQGRTQLLQEKNLGHLDTQVRGRAEAVFVDWWAENRSGLSAAETALLRTMLEEKFLRETYMLALGVVSSMHEDTTPTLAKMQKEVTQKEVLAWYNAHKEDFRQVEKVRVRHISCKTEADCNIAIDAIKKGMDFSEAARKFSIADSRSATPAGSLGWIKREEKNLPWLHQLALIQHAGEMTPPIRSPEDAQRNAVWEVVLVDERVEGYSPPHSETVRYQAAQEIAKRKLIDRYIGIRDGLKTKAKIQRNAALLKAREPKPKTGDT